MRYMMLIYHDEAKAATKSEAEMQTLFAGYDRFTKDLQGAGLMQGGEPFQPSMTATTVRSPGGTMKTTDGPAADTNEQLAGFYLIEAKDLDEAIEWAARIPDADGGSIEVRPILDLAGMM